MSKNLFCLSNKSGQSRGVTAPLRYPQEGGHEYSVSKYNVIRLFKVRCGHRTLRFVKINAHSVGVDAHIDPRIFAKALS